MPIEPNNVNFLVRRPQDDIFNLLSGLGKAVKMKQSLISSQRHSNLILKSSLKP